MIGKGFGRGAACRAPANLLINPLQGGAKNLPVHGDIQPLWFQPLRWITQPAKGWHTVSPNQRNGHF